MARENGAFWKSGSEAEAIGLCMYIYKQSIY